MDFKMLVYCIVEIISYVWNLNWNKHIDHREISYFINPKLCRKVESFRNIEIKSCGLIHNRWLGGWAGDHLNNSHLHIFKSLDELFNFANLSCFVPTELVYVKILTETCFYYWQKNCLEHLVHKGQQSISPSIRNVIFPEGDTGQISLLFTLLPNKVETSKVPKASSPIKDKERLRSILKYKIDLWKLQEQP